MDTSIAIYIAATVVLWAVSGALGLTAGILLASIPARGRGLWSVAGTVMTTLSRGLPTSLLVVIAGVSAARLPAAPWLPNLFPGTPDGMQAVAWLVIVALAIGSAGHFAVIFRAAYLVLGQDRIHQLQVLGISPVARFRLLARETAVTAVPPTAARLVHHLHNTAFASLFPVADLFGWIEDRANATFDVVHYALIGAVAYVVLSGLIWTGSRLLEAELVGGSPRLRRISVQVAGLQ